MPWGWVPTNRYRFGRGCASECAFFKKSMLGNPAVAVFVLLKNSALLLILLKVQQHLYFFKKTYLKAKFHLILKVFASVCPKVALKMHTSHGVWLLWAFSCFMFGSLWAILFGILTCQTPCVICMDFIRVGHGARAPNFPKRSPHQILHAQPPFQNIENLPFLCLGVGCLRIDIVLAWGVHQNVPF